MTYLAHQIHPARAMTAGDQKEAVKLTIVIFCPSPKQTLNQQNGK